MPGSPGFSIGMMNMGGEFGRVLNAMSDAERTLMDPAKLAHHLVSNFAPNPLELGIANAIEAHDKQLLAKYEGKMDDVVKLHERMVAEISRLKNEKNEAAVWYEAVEAKLDDVEKALGPARKALTPPPGNVYDDNGFALIKVGELGALVTALGGLFGAIISRTK